MGLFPFLTRIWLNNGAFAGGGTDGYGSGLTVALEEVVPEITDLEPEYALELEEGTSPATEEGAMEADEAPRGRKVTLLV